MTETQTRLRQYFRDPIVLMTVGVLVAVYLIFELLDPGTDLFYVLTELLSFLPLALFASVAPWVGLPPMESSRERTFWRLWSSSFGVLLLVRLLMVWNYWAGGPWTGAVHWDILYGAFYLGLLLSLANRPDEERSSKADRGLSILEAVGLGTFLLSLLAYFVFVSWSFDPWEHRSWLPSYLFYWVADVFLLTGLLYLRQTSTSRRWRILFSWLLVVPVLWSISEVLESIYYMGAEDTEWYGQAWLNMLWYIPMALVALVGRMRLGPFPDRFGGDAPAVEDRELVQSLGRPGLLVMLAIVLPMLHLGTNLLDLLSESTREFRELVVVVSTACLLGLALFHQRLLERRARELAIRSRESEEHRRWLAAAVERSPDAVLIADGAGMLRYANPASESAGIPVRDLLGAPLKDLLPQELAADGRLEKALEEGIAWDGRHTSMGPDGEPREEILSLTPTRDGEGNVLQWVLMRNDVTYLAQLERKLGQAQKMEALGTLAGGIAHDFNNILGAIYGYAEILSMDLEPDSQAQEDLRGLQTAAERAAELVAQILTFSRQGEEKKTPLDLEPVVRDASSLLRATLPSTIRIQEEVSTEGVVISGVRHQIQQILLNLGTNAAHAMGEEGGVLEIGLRSTFLSRSRALERGLAESGKYALLWVRDTGAGMDEATAGRIFDPFFTTKEVGKGTGLGLSVVHGSVQNHGGAITVESEPEKGSCFEILLPLTGEAAGEAAGKGSPPRGSGQALLIVDDEPMLTNLATQILEDLGYAPTAFNSSSEALYEFLRDPDRYDALITDQTMPTMTGIELARKAREARQDFPVLLSTGYSELLSPDRLRGAGIGRVLMKPYHREELGWAVAELLDLLGAP